MSFLRDAMEVEIEERIAAALTAERARLRVAVEAERWPREQAMGQWRDGWNSAIALVLALLADT